MKKREIYRGITFTAGAAALMLAGMLAVSLLNGGLTAQDFESLQATGAYASAILEAEGPLRAILTFDNLFLIFYTAAFVFIGIATWRKRTRLLVLTALLAILVTTYLDIQENAELLSFVALAQNGLGIEGALLHERAVLSQVKFMSSYLSFFLFAFVLPRDTALERLLRWSLWTLAPLVGVLVYTYPSSLWSLGRYGFMLAGLAIIAWNYWLRASRKWK